MNPGTVRNTRQQSAADRTGMELLARRLRILVIVNGAALLPLLPGPAGYAERQADAAPATTQAEPPCALNPASSAGRMPAPVPAPCTMLRLPENHDVHLQK